MRSHGITKTVSILLAASFWLAQPGWAQDAGPAQSPASATTAQQDHPRAQSSPQSTAGNTQTAPAQPSQKRQTQKAPVSGTTVNPSQGPLQPVTTYPDAAGAPPSSPGQAGATPPNAPQPQAQPSEPQGAATAERVPIAGGAAAKPAGIAIAPAKQHRTRSLLIKFGAIAAAGVAAGTIYALSRGTSSTPPGANGPGAVPK